MQSFLNYNQDPAPEMSPEQRKQMMQQQLMQQIMGEHAQNPMQGATQLATGVGMGLNKWNDQQQFPAKPGMSDAPANTGSANPFAKLSQLFNFGRGSVGQSSGGLY